MLVLSISAAMYLGYMGLSELLERRAGDAYYDRLSAAMSGLASTHDGAVPNADSALDSNSPFADTDDAMAGIDREIADSDVTPPVADGMVMDSDATPLDSTGSNAHARKASVVDFDALWETCPDVVGWITIEDTCIDYPVVQGTDNQYYLSHLPDGAANSAGSILMDAACDPFYGNDVTILHGHHMRSGAMFGDLDEYSRAAYYEAHPTIRLYTPYGDYEVDVFAACTVNGATFGYPTVFADEQAFDDFVASLVSSSAFETDVMVAYGDRLLLLSTCAYSFENARFVVVGKIRENA